LSKKLVPLLPCRTLLCRFHPSQVDWKARKRVSELLLIEALSEADEEQAVDVAVSPDFPKALVSKKTTKKAAKTVATILQKASES
jgi:hypothetical protein